MAWTRGQVKDFVREAKKSMNGAWSNPLFTNEIREMLLAREFTRVITGQVEGTTLKAEDVDKLWHDMNVEAGIYGVTP